ncbi:MAG: single-stranded DNA-binding protein [Rickettsiales bacterium]|jgi:single-strand DNA-binding protein|nr:single-stranded DNA-binding protein [Rickettsiales bacterium]
MANSINKVTLIGNVGKDPEIRTTQDGKEIASITLATSESWKDKMSGERKERTEWHRIVVFADGLVNIIKNYVKKGSKLYIEGSLQTRKWVDNSGIERYTTEIALQGFGAVLLMLDNRNGGENHTNNPSSSNMNFNAEEIDDEIPF